MYHKIFIFFLLAVFNFSLMTYGASESDIPTGRYRLDAGTGHEGQIYVDYPWISSYRTFVLRAPGKMPTIKSLESPPGPGVLNPNDGTIEAGMGATATLTFVSEVSSSLSSAIRAELGIPATASIGGTTTGTITITLGVRNQVPKMNSAIGTKS